MYIIAHRGASAEAPENTLSSIRKALEIGADFIEIDVHLSRDGIPVVVHDPHLERTTNLQKKERVNDWDLARIKSLDAGRWFHSDFAGERIPTLEEILSLDLGNTGLMIEIKKGHSSLSTLVNEVINRLNNANGKQIIVGSFSAHILELFKNKAPHIELMPIIKDFHMLPVMQKLEFKTITLYYKMVTPYLVSNFHESGKSVWAYTVDNPKIAEFLKSIGLDGLITNNPRTFI